MINDNEVREAVEFCKEVIRTGDHEGMEIWSDEWRAEPKLQTLLDLAQLYLSCSGAMPEKKEIDIKNKTNLEDIPGHLGFNQAIDACRLSLVKKLSGVSDFLMIVSEKAKEMITICEREKFVFDNIDDRWQKLAFTFYTQIVHLSEKATAIRKEIMLEDSDK